MMVVTYYVYLIRYHQVQENADKWEYCWLFEVGNMRNAHLKTVRKLWKECVACVTMPCLSFMY